MGFVVPTFVIVVMYSPYQREPPRLALCEILKHLESYKYIRDGYYEFRQQRSAADLLNVTHIWNDTIQYYGEPQFVALDIINAFALDQAWHVALLKKSFWGPL